MSYKYSKGEQAIGDLKAADDIQRDTLIDLEKMPFIALVTPKDLELDLMVRNTFNRAFTFPVKMDRITNSSNKWIMLSWNNPAVGGNSLTVTFIRRRTIPLPIMKLFLLILLEPLTM